MQTDPTKIPVPRLWRGATVAILGGGPSLTLDQIETVRARGWRMIAINNAYQIAMDADLLWWCDRQWYDLHRDHPDFVAFPGIRATLDNRSLPADYHLANTGPAGIETAPNGVRTGSNSAHQTINLCCHLGAARVVLLGIDGKYLDGRSHWHGGHPLPHDEAFYQDKMIPLLHTAVQPLRDLGVEVINANPNSAVDAFPRLALSDIA